MHSLSPLSPSHPLIIKYHSSTTSAGKDVVILLDLTENMTSQHFQTSSYKQLIEHLLTTLASIDYFTILAGKTSFSPTLVLANYTNLENVIESFLPSLNFFPDHQHDLVDRAFVVLNNSRGVNGVGVTSALCQSAIVIITDRELVRDLPRTVHIWNDMNLKIHGNDAMAKIFVNSNVTDFERNGTTELDVTCNSSGIWNRISNYGNDIARGYDAVAGYYKVLSRSVNVQEAVLSKISNSSHGFVKNGYSLCLPVYNESIFEYYDPLGVSCTILPLQEVERLDSSEGVEVGVQRVRSVKVC